ncbi:unnamed protein product [Heligmosomoides polygyrus]|uniref:Uncharacterized protein n=1 Tax=Heligmosomoides polygyrus TaxID=6339 RepID=A0A183F580_HELPZ|nr:unnamed protein product [Heligmosomoides polygyrus]
MSKVSETVRVLEQASSHPPHDDVVELSYEMKEPKRQRMVSIGTPESINLDEIDLPRWSPNRSVGAGASSSGYKDRFQKACSVLGPKKMPQLCIAQRSYLNDLPLRFFLFHIRPAAHE